MSDFEPPIQNLDAFDIVGERLDGGVDLVVVCSGPLDDSADTLGRLRQKISNYLREVASQSFQAQFGAESPITIFISCPHSVSGAAGGLINTLRKEASNHGVELQLVKDMA
jgi:hypothetical protein